MALVDAASQRRTFTLEDAQQLLPAVRRMTVEAVNRAEVLSAQLEGIPESDPEHKRLADELNQVVTNWTQSIRSLDVEVKGLWLVDFDNGHGYYCWRYPEASVSHYHSYDEGFAGRMKIV
jgi:hypothetical protein